MSLWQKLNSPSITGGPKEQANLEGKGAFSEDKTSVDLESKDYTSCFSQYNKKYLPENIGKYSNGEIIFQDAPIEKSGFRVRDRVTTVKWGLHTAYFSTDKMNADLTIASLTKPNHFSDYNDTNDNVEGLPVNIHYGPFTQNPRFPGEGTINISTIVPGTKTLIYFSFQIAEKDYKKIFSDWLKTVCG